LSYVPSGSGEIPEKGAMQIDFHSTIEEIDAASWNRLAGDGNPFLSHEFHAALEHHDCVGPRFGWHPRHLTVSHEGHLIGASPLYLKDNSYGEFVFDHAWAEAYQRYGANYYPKLVCAIPYTPAFGERLLATGDGKRQELRKAMVEATLQQAVGADCSSVHWLFTTEEEGVLLKEMGMCERLGVQFHWQNRGYGSFDDFLSGLTSKRRKNILRERRRVREAGVTFRWLHGREVSKAEWRLFSDFYAKTFAERYSLATLNLGFFQEIARSLGDRVVLILAYAGPRCIAGSLFYRGDKILYGRHWGTIEVLDSLHFETCYYQGIEYAIRHRLQGFEPGAQGEHKIWRGFLPTLTRSYHWIADERFREAIEGFLRRERPAIADYWETLRASSPYRLPQNL
jgi:predicted N-acyltransferase